MDEETLGRYQNFSKVLKKIYGNHSQKLKQKMLMNMNDGLLCDRINGKHYSYTIMTNLLEKNYKYLHWRQNSEVQLQDLKERKCYGSGLKYQYYLLEQLIESFDEKVFDSWGRDVIIESLVDSKDKMWILTKKQAFVMDKGVKRSVLKCSRRFGIRSRFLGMKSEGIGNFVY